MSTKAYMIVLVIIAKSVIIKPEQKESLLQSKESFHIISKRIQESFKCQCEECDQQARTNINLNKNKKCSHEREMLPSSNWQFKLER